MASKLDIMNNRKDENWELINGKVQRVEGPVIQSGITEVEIKETATPKLTDKVITEKKEVKKKSKTKKK